MRMRAAIPIAALVLVAGARSEAQAADAPALSALIQKACIDTGMRREAFEQLARGEHWRAVSARSSFRQTGWSLAYRVGAHTVMLSRIITDNDATDTNVGTLCSLLTTEPPSGWHDDVVHFAAEQGLAAESSPSLPPGVAPMETWSRFRGYTLTAAFSASPPTLSLSFSRQIVIDGPSTTVAVGR